MGSSTVFLVKALVTALTLYLSALVYRVIRNIVLARKTNFPCVLVPVDQNAVAWIVLSLPLRAWLQRHLPHSLWKRVVLTIYGWEYHERSRPFLEFSKPAGNDKSFVLAGLGNIELWTQDPELANEILRRPQDFRQVELNSLFMNKFGENVLTSDGEVWSRHRKIVASVINERISEAVWTETIRQTEGLLGELFGDAKLNEETSETNQMPDLLKKVTIHVLSGAGMGTTKTWQDTDDDKPKAGYRQTYIQCTQTVMNAVTGPIILPSWFLRGYPSFLPGYNYIKSLHYAMNEFNVHTQDMLNQERARLSEEPGVMKNNILSQLVNASNNEEKSSALSDSDLKGNLFIFTAAGFETTANTLTYAFAMLARHPQWQEWLFEEIDSIMPLAKSTDPKYTTVFPRANRVMAFLLETLRLFPPLIHISKMTGASTTLETSSGRHWLPEKVTVYIHVVGLHLDPSVWRNLNLPGPESTISPSVEDSLLDDELVFRPTRWLNPPGSKMAIFQPPKGNFLPWSMGPRVCPGQKMAQVEFTAVFLTLLRSCRVDPVMSPGATRDDINKHLDTQLKNSMSVLTLQMNDIYGVDAAKPTEGLNLKLSKRL